MVNVSGCRGLRAPGKGLGDGGEEAGLHPVRLRAGHGDRHLDALLDERPDFGVERVQFVRPRLAAKRRPELRKRVPGGKSVGLARAEVVAGVVGRVAAQPQRPRLDKHGPRGARAPSRSRRRASLRSGPDRRSRSRGPPCRSRPPGARARCRCGNCSCGGRRVGVAVVLDHEHDRKRQERGQVQGLVHVARARRAVAEEREADGLAAEPPLRVGGAEDGPAHRPQVADHRQRAVGRVAVVDVALARPGRAVRVREVLVQVLAEVPAPDEVPAEVPVGEAR